MDDVAVRRFEPARHAEAFRQCLIEQQDFHRRLEPTWPEGATIVESYVAYLETACATHNGSILIAERSGGVAGFICVVASSRGESPEDPAPYAWVHELYVKPAHRRFGVASRLIAEAESFARSQGATRLRLAVLDKNAGARDFYDAHGYRPHAHVLTKEL